MKLRHAIVASLISADRGAAGCCAFTEVGRSPSERGGRVANDAFEPGQPVRLSSSPPAFIAPKHTTLAGLRSPGRTWSILRAASHADDRPERAWPLSPRCDDPNGHAGLAWACALRETQILQAAQDLNGSREVDVVTRLVCQTVERLQSVLSATEIPPRAADDVATDAKVVASTARLDAMLDALDRHLASQSPPTTAVQAMLQGYEQQFEYLRLLVNLLTEGHTLKRDSRVSASIERRLAERDLDTEHLRELVAVILFRMRTMKPGDDRDVQEATARASLLSMLR